MIHKELCKVPSNVSRKLLLQIFEDLARLATIYMTFLEKDDLVWHIMVERLCELNDFLVFPRFLI